MFVRFFKRKHVKRGVLNGTSFPFKQTTKLGFKEENPSGFVALSRTTQYPISELGMELCKSEAIIRTTKTHFYTHLMYAIALDSYYESFEFINTLLEELNEEVKNHKEKEEKE